MRFFGLLFLLFPFLELLLLISVGSAIGALPAIGLVVLGSVCGVLVLRQVGWRTAWAVEQRLQQGEPPTAELLDGFALAVGGLLLLLPGLLSDVLGIFCLLRPLRRGLARRLLAARTGSRASSSAPHPPRRPEVIEGEYTRLDERDRK